MITGTVLAFFHPEAPAKTSHPAAAGLTFAERVAYQRAIEDVYWRHRIWPRNRGERPDPKPSLDAVMSQVQLENKVHDYLRKSRALQDYWQQPITSEQLQTEMDRMAKQTKQPEVLRELFEALGNDPLVAAECLARPILAERLFKSALDSQDSTWSVTYLAKSHVADGARMSGYTLPSISTAPKGESTCLDLWEPTTTVNAPAARSLNTAVWTGTEMIVWGGYDGNDLNTGGRYNPATDNWTATNTINAPAGREKHTAVWTGTEMVVWGGEQGFSYVNTGGRYKPSTDSWTGTSTTNAPSGRYFHTAIGTDSEMIVWGGCSDNSCLTPLLTGGRYCAQGGPTATPPVTPTVTPTATPTPITTPRPTLTPKPRPTPAPRP